MVIRKLTYVVGSCLLGVSALRVENWTLVVAAACFLLGTLWTCEGEEG